MYLIVIEPALTPPLEVWYTCVRTPICNASPLKTP